MYISKQSYIYNTHSTHIYIYIYIHVYVNMYVNDYASYSGTCLKSPGFVA